MIKILIKKRVKHDKQHPFRILDNRAFYDKRLTPMAKILLIHLLGCNEKKYTPTIPQIAKQFNVSESTIDRSIANLIKYGYMTSTHIGAKKNAVVSWWIFEIPDYMDKSTGAVYEDINSDSTDAVYEDINSDSTDAVYEDINSDSTDAVYEDINSDSTDAGVVTLYIKDINLGVDKSTPPNEKNEKTLPNDFFIPIGREMTEEERKRLSDSLPF